MLEKLGPSLKKDPSVVGRARERALELPESKEKWTTNFSALTISGTTATGKTTISVVLGEIYEIPEKRNVKVGQIIRGEQNKKDEEGYIERPIKLDQDVDQLQAEILTRTATIATPFIIEGRLAGVIAQEEKAKKPDLAVVTILLTASEETMRKRVKERNPELSDKAIHDLVTQRSTGDLARWTELHPQLKDSGPYDPARYDIVINTNNKPVNQVFRDIHEELKRRGLVKKKPEVNKSSLRTKGQIFPKNL